MKEVSGVSIAVIVAGALAIVAAQTAQGQGRQQVKCYGIAKAGQNDCASHNGSHSCAGQAKTNNDSNEWKFVKSADDCRKLGGATQPRR